MSTWYNPMNCYVFLVIPIIVGILTGYFIVLNSNADSLTLFTVTKLTENGSPINGNLSSPITILEWGDYQCTFCFKFHESSLQILKLEYINTGKVKIVFKDFPLNGPDSILAAEATYCAMEQGKYWEYHDQIYENWAGEKTGWITQESLNIFARHIKLDILQFNDCLDSARYKQKVLDLKEFGKKIGVDATPTFFIFNDEKIIKIRGNQPLDVFKQAIDKLNMISS